MAVVPVCYKMFYKDQALSIPKEIRQAEGCVMSCGVSTQFSGRFSKVSNDSSRRRLALYNTSDCVTKENTRKYINVSHETISHLSSSSDNVSERKKLCTGKALELSSSEKQLRLLDSYFGKLQKNVKQPSSNSLNYEAELLDRSDQSQANKELASLDDYFGKLNGDANSKGYVPSTSVSKRIKAAEYYVKGGSQSGIQKLERKLELKDKDGKVGPKSTNNETSSLYVISILASINIAVSLFEIASPIRNSDLELFSLPSLYGAKINDLILIGEWWRLVTPMFLHSGILHVSLGCWMLLTFGPPVCRSYGSFTFFLIYILGGLAGNLTSFLHTPEPTVGGTGPAFAVIGAWLIYQLQNRDINEKGASERMFRKAILATALSFILSSFGPIDAWAHFGAAFTGIAYGFLTCPTLQMDDTSSETGQEEGITLVRRNAHPCKSLLFFSLFILILSSLLFLIEPPLNSLATDSFVKMLDTWLHS